MSVLTHSKVMSIFNYVIRVVAAMTCQAGSLYSPITRKYKMWLTLKHSTIGIHAYVIVKDGDTFFIVILMLKSWKESQIDYLRLS